LAQLCKQCLKRLIALVSLVQRSLYRRGIQAYCLFLWLLRRHPVSHGRAGLRRHPNDRNQGGNIEFRITPMGTMRQSE